MKLQQLAIIFIIIVVPISLVLSEYTNNNIEVLQRQSEYNDILLSSTYDAIRAFQMNTLNNGYSTINDSKIRDISAAVNSFYNSLASALGTSGYTITDLQGYIPALLFTMYDGYYIYGNYQNVVSVQNGKQNYSTQNINELNSTNGIKPYIYYTCEYTSGAYLDIIVNYTLDNYISIMGTDGNKNTVNRAGYLINPSTVTEINEQNKTLKAHGILVEPEILGEYIEVIDTVRRASGTGTTMVAQGSPVYYNYVYYNNQKYYIDNKTSDENISTYSTYQGIRFFRLNNNIRTYLNENEARGLAQFLTGNENNISNIYNNFVNGDKTLFRDASAYRYYKEAKEFSEYVISIFSGRTLSIVTDSYNNQVNYTTTPDGSNTQVPIHSRASYNPSDIFVINANNDPEAEDSLFNEHRMDVIISSIESSLMSIIANFNLHQNSGYEFALPVMSEEDWYTITNNITIVTFLQGLPVKNFKYYSNYAVVANTKNKEFVSRDSILIRDVESGNASDSSGTYHNPRCMALSDSNPTNIIGYSNIDFEQQTILLPEEQESQETQTLYYYPHSGAGGYECIIGKEDLLYTSDNLMLGTQYNILDDDGNIIETKNVNNNVRKAYIQALAREKYNLYKVNSYFNEY